MSFSEITCLAMSSAFGDKVLNHSDWVLISKLYSYLPLQRISFRQRAEFKLNFFVFNFF